jgi:hypothetical protein
MAQWIDDSIQEKGKSGNEDGLKHRGTFSRLRESRREIKPKLRMAVFILDFSFVLF